MRFKIVPSTRDGRQQLLTTYLINDTLAIDAGAIAVGLSHAEQRRLRSIIITHAHLDHVISLPLFLTDLFEEFREPVKIYATNSDFDALREHLFNHRIWIPLELMRNEHTELILHIPFKSGESFIVEGLKITPIPVTHTIQTHGLIVDDGKSALLFTSDTGATNQIWQAAEGCSNLRAVFIDLSFPARLTGLAIDSCHHSTSTIFEELAKIKPDVPVYAIHLKPAHRAEVISEISAANQLRSDARIEIAEVGREYEF